MGYCIVGYIEFGNDEFYHDANMSMSQNRFYSYDFFSFLQKLFHPIVALFAWLSTYWGSQYTGSQPCISKDALLTTVSTCMILALDKKVLEFLQRIKIWKNSISMPGWKKHEISAVKLEMPSKFW